MTRLLAGLVLSLSLSPAMPPLALAADADKSAAAESSHTTEGEVRKVDKDAGKVTIRHGPIEALGMPAMTMVYRVADPGMLDRLKTGDKIRFAAEKVNGSFVVVKVDPAN